jgi:hypothetical protein
MVQRVPVAEREQFSSWVFLTSLWRAKDRNSPFKSKLRSAHNSRPGCSSLARQRSKFPFQVDAITDRAKDM